jgi:hypothetical protein
MIVLGRLDGSLFKSNSDSFAGVLAPITAAYDFQKDGLPALHIMSSEVTFSPVLY